MKQDFTPMDKGKPFSVHYPIATISFHYEPDMDPDCYILTLEKLDPINTFDMDIITGSDAISTKKDWPKSVKTCSRMVCIDLYNLDAWTV